jgi:hypothetical protein
MPQPRQQQPKKPPLDLDSLPDQYFQYILRLRNEASSTRADRNRLREENAELKATIKALIGGSE